MNLHLTYILRQTLVGANSEGRNVKSQRENMSDSFHDLALKTISEQDVKNSKQKSLIDKNSPIRLDVKTKTRPGALKQTQNQEKGFNLTRYMKK